jgi:hypothetical protein
LLCRPMDCSPLQKGSDGILSLQPEDFGAPENETVRA